MLTRVPFETSLAKNNVTRNDLLSTGFLEAQTTTGGILVVPC